MENFLQYILTKYRGPIESNSERYKKIRDALVFNHYPNNYKFMPFIRESIIKDFLFSDSTFKNVITDEDAVFILNESSKWHQLDFDASAEIKIIKHAMPHIKNIEKEHLLMRRMKFHSFTGYPSFVEHDKGGILVHEEKVIGHCSSGIPNFVQGVQINVKDSLKDAYDGDFHWMHLKSLFEKRHVVDDDGKTYKKLLKEIIDKQYTVKSVNFKIIEKETLEKMHKDTRDLFNNFNVEPETTSQNIENIIEICQESMKKIEKLCKVEYKKKVLTWEEMNKEEHTFDDDDWRNAEGAVLAQVYTYGSYIRLHLLMICACKVDLARLNEEKEFIQGKVSKKSEVNELSGVMRINTKVSQSEAEKKAQQQLDRENASKAATLKKDDVEQNDDDKRKKKKKKKKKHTVSESDLGDEIDMNLILSDYFEYDLKVITDLKILVNDLKKASEIYERPFIYSIIEKVEKCLDRGLDTLDMHDVFDLFEALIIPSNLEKAGQIHDFIMKDYITLLERVMGICLGHISYLRSQEGYEDYEYREEDSILLTSQAFHIIGNFTEKIYNSINQNTKLLYELRANSDTQANKIKEITDKIQIAYKILRYLLDIYRVHISQDTRFNNPMEDNSKWKKKSPDQPSKRFSDVGTSSNPEVLKEGDYSGTQKRMSLVVAKIFNQYIRQKNVLVEIICHIIKTYQTSYKDYKEFLKEINITSEKNIENLFDMLQNDIEKNVTSYIIECFDIMLDNDISESTIMKIFDSVLKTLRLIQAVKSLNSKNKEWNFVSTVRYEEKLIQLYHRIVMFNTDFNNLSQTNRNKIIFDLVKDFIIPCLCDPDIFLTHHHHKSKNMFNMSEYWFIFRLLRFLYKNFSMFISDKLGTHVPYVQMAEIDFYFNDKPTIKYRWPCTLIYTEFDSKSESDSDSDSDNNDTDEKFRMYLEIKDVPQKMRENIKQQLCKKIENDCVVHGFLNAKDDSIFNREDLEINTIISNLNFYLYEQNITITKIRNKGTLLNILIKFLKNRYFEKMRQPKISINEATVNYKEKQKEVNELETAIIDNLRYNLQFFRNLNTFYIFTIGENTLFKKILCKVILNFSHDMNIKVFHFDTSQTYEDLSEECFDFKILSETHKDFPDSKDAFLKVIGKQKKEDTWYNKEWSFNDERKEIKESVQNPTSFNISHQNLFLDFSKEKNGIKGIESYEKTSEDRKSIINVLYDFNDEELQTFLEREDSVFFNWDNDGNIALVQDLAFKTKQITV